jgi:hypothetical protein
MLNDKMSPPVRRRRLWTRLLGIVMALTAGAIFVAVEPSTPAFASGSCYANSCTGQDPVATGCWADAITVQTVQQGSVLLDLRYSPSCAANWARMRNAQFGWHVTVYNTWGQSEDVTYWFGDTTVWTAMVNGQPPAWACFDNGNCTGQF